jgi:hypothetical protein
VPVGTIESRAQQWKVYANDGDLPNTHRQSDEMRTLGRPSQLGQSGEPDELCIIGLLGALSESSAIETSHA